MYKMPFFICSVNDNHQEFMWDPKEPEGAGDGAIANHRQPFSEFNFLTIASSQVKVSQQLSGCW